VPESGQPAPSWPSRPTDGTPEPAVAAGGGDAVDWPAADGDTAALPWPAEQPSSHDGVNSAEPVPEPDDADGPNSEPDSSAEETPVEAEESAPAPAAETEPDSAGPDSAGTVTADPDSAVTEPPSPAEESDSSAEDASAAADEAVAEEIVAEEIVAEEIVAEEAVAEESASEETPEAVEAAEPDPTPADQSAEEPDSEPAEADEAVDPSPVAASTPEPEETSDPGPREPDADPEPGSLSELYSTFTAAEDRAPAPFAAFTPAEDPDPAPEPPAPAPPEKAFSAFAPVVEPEPAPPPEPPTARMPAPTPKPAAPPPPSPKPNQPEASTLPLTAPDTKQLGPKRPDPSQAPTPPRGLSTPPRPAQGPKPAPTLAAPLRPPVPPRPPVPAPAPPNRAAALNRPQPQPPARPAAFTPNRPRPSSEPETIRIQLEDTVSMPVDNDRARLDPPTVQLPPRSKQQLGDEAPTVRVQLPRPPAAGRPELGDDVPQPAPQLPPPPRTSEENEPPRRRSKKPLLVGLALALVVALGVGTYFGTSGLGGTTVVATAPPPSPAAPQELIKPLGDGPSPTAQGITAALAGPTSSPALGTLTGSVVDPSTGTTLWDRNSASPLTPASAGKLLTMTAALLSLDPQFRFTTTVVAGPDPSTVIIVGGGDPTISSLPAGKDSVYPGAAHLDDLVAQVKKATGGTVHKVLLDTSRYSGDSMAPGWETSDIAGGSVAPITPFMLDGGRSRPTASEPSRTATPDTDAAREFARRLGADPSAVAKTTAPADAKVLGSVQSPPLTDMVGNLLQISDNVLAEAIGREVAKQAGAPETFAGGATSVLNILRSNNFDLTGVTMVDGSGLSTQDRVTARLLSSIMAVAAGPDGGDQRVAKLRPLLNGLPVAGGSGTLSDRYHDAASAPGKGWVRAKTGTLDGVNTLAGVVQDSDGKVLAFALMSNGSAIDQGRAALDAVAAALRGCGCR
jgi:D-alanyl-D-alanine carboxypeptidase/D-alanyl-D-alanine-endopeptidase (penicillin-binding protein 4)